MPYIPILLQALSVMPARDSSALRHADGRMPPTVAAVRVQRPPTLDGRLDDDAWREATPTGGFRQTDPTEGAAASESTLVYLVYDDAAIYVGLRLFDDEPTRVLRRLGRRDDNLQSDMVYVDFDSYHDHRTAFEFAVNPAGVKTDDLTSNDFFVGDRSWEPVWDVATAIDSLGWVAEMRIPFSQLRFPQRQDQLWGFQVFRWVFRKSEMSLLAFVPKNETGYASRFAHLVGLRDIPAPRHFEVLPYTLGRGTYDPAGSSYFGGAGLDAKYGLTSNLTLDASVNPDFGQVEQDPALVNLTAFETFLEERRPFFVEGASIFQFGGTGSYIGFGGTPQYFYSRRIGREGSTILGAAKLTGKTPSGWSIGVLDAITQREHSTDQPFTNLFVARVNREIGGHTGFGLLGTAVQRRLDDPAFDEFRRGAYVAGGDFFHRWQNNTYAFLASVGAAVVTGDPLALQTTQTLSSRYYQRPDQSYMRYDPTRTSLSGVSSDLSLSKEGGNTNWAVGFSTTTPGFEVNDLGFQTRVDRISAAAFLGHRWTKPGNVFRQASLSATVGPSWNYGGDMIQMNVSANAFGQLLNYWGMNVFGFHDQQAVDDRLTRGGPLSLTPEGWGVGANLFSDGRKSITAGLFASYSHDVAGGWNMQFSPSVSWHPSSAITVRLGPTYSAGRSAAQFLESVSDPLATTFGARYLFGRLSQHQLDLTARLGFTFTPTLSFQLYVQPFVFTADYDQFKELRAPRTFDFTVYGRDDGSTAQFDTSSNSYLIDPDGNGGPADTLRLANPDFRIRAFQSNAVLRWEYRPGSTVYLIWTQSRSGFFDDPTVQFGHDLGQGLLHDPPTNVLIVKFNYWLSL